MKKDAFARALKCALRDKHHFTQLSGTKEDPLLLAGRDGRYKVIVESRTYTVTTVNGNVVLCEYEGED